MEVWDESSSVEVLIRSDSAVDLRERITAAPERITKHLATVGLVATSVTPREIGAQSADAIIFVCNLKQEA